MIEVLVTLLITSLGLLGIAALFANSQKFVDESFQRNEALSIARQLSERIAANLVNARAGTSSKYNIGSDASAAPGSGSFSTSTSRDCSSAACTPVELADYDMRQFDSALQGASKRTTSGSANVQGLTLARGCVRFIDDAGSTTDVGRYEITVAWQGRDDSAAPPSTNTCAQNLYDSNDRRRRIVSLVVVP